MYKDVNLPTDISSGTIIALSRYINQDSKAYYGIKERPALRDPRIDGIDLAVISLYISDDIRQSLNELAIRLSIECMYKYDLTLEYLKSLKYPNIGYYTNITVNGKTKYQLNPWEPGDKQPIFLAYSQWDSAKIMRRPH